ncbi:MAG: hypothetical protein IJM63_07020, partial [Solobacterium sp.]|nr:hypothetical protein [Solobacterium sp.]
NDDRDVLEFYYEHRNDSPAELTHAVMTNEKMWGMDLTSVEGFEEAACAALDLIRKEGVLAAYAKALGKEKADA